MPVPVFAILAAGWISWCAPFFLLKRPGKPPTLDKRARWGIAIQTVAYWLIWFPPLWTGPPDAGRMALSVLLLTAGNLMVWTAVRALGRQWRIDAGLNDDHELVQAGPYRLVRHPIYSSMMLMMLASGAMLAQWWLLGVATAIFVIGTEIRVRVEDSLLASRFGGKFDEYRQAVPAYIPFVR